MIKLIQNTVFWDCFSFTKVAFTMVKVVCYFEFYTSLKFFSEYFAIFQNVTISNNLPNSLNTKHLFQKLYCINPSNLDWSCSSLQRIYFISLDQKNFYTLFGCSTLAISIVSLSSLPKSFSKMNMGRVGAAD